MMKKLISVLTGITFIIVLFFNISISANQKNDSDIKLKNLEASACYYVYDESAPPPYGFFQCCAPYTNTCSNKFSLLGVLYSM